MMNYSWNLELLDPLSLISILGNADTGERFRLSRRFRPALIGGIGMWGERHTL